MHTMLLSFDAPRFAGTNALPPRFGGLPRLDIRYSAFDIMSFIFLIAVRTLGKDEQKDYPSGRIRV
jgi:hypothetical protein